MRSLITLAIIFQVMILFAYFVEKSIITPMAVKKGFETKIERIETITPDPLAPFTSSFKSLWSNNETRHSYKQDFMRIERNRQIDFSRIQNDLKTPSLPKVENYNFKTTPFSTPRIKIYRPTDRY